MKPVINLNDLSWEREQGGGFEQRYGVVGERIGAKMLGYNLTICPPGKKACPFHSHHNNEEMFLILEGEGVLRFGDKEYPVRAHDVIACPPGGREVAHQIVNTGTTDLKYLAVSTMEAVDVCEYPDSQKIGVLDHAAGGASLRAFFLASSAVEYGEKER